MSEFAPEHGSLEGWPTGTRITNEELLELPCDILVLAAREDQVTEENAGRIQARMIAEGANGPTSLEARRDPRRARDPDPAGHPHERRRRHRLVLRVGAGSRAALLGARRDPREARAEKLNDAFDRVWEISKERDVTLRTAALVAGIREVASALDARGLYP